MTKSDDDCDLTCQDEFHAAIAPFEAHTFDRDDQNRLVEFCWGKPARKEKAYLAVLNQIAVTKSAELKRLARVFGTPYCACGGNMTPLTDRSPESVRLAISHDVFVRLRSD